MPTYEQVIEALQPVEDPELHGAIIPGAHRVS